MKRFALILAALGILCVAVGQAQAHPYYYGHGAYHGAYYRPVVVRPPIVVAPRVVVPVPAYPPVYSPYCYYPDPGYGFYYRGPGVSVGVGPGVSVGVGF